MGKKGHEDFSCTICGTDIEVPMCCEEKIMIKKGDVVKLDMGGHVVK